jgi:flavin-dependent dehydrogenase
LSGGLYTAIAAAETGHDVTVYEKESHVVVVSIMIQFLQQKEK